jgi:adenine-specific DNA-methyltransferase
VRAVMDEVFGEESFVSLITVEKTSGSTQEFLPSVCDFVVWYARSRRALKFRKVQSPKIVGGEGGAAYTFVQLPDGRRLRSSVATDQEAAQGRAFRLSDMTSQSIGRQKGEGAASWFAVEIRGRSIRPGHQVRWKTNELGMKRLALADRLESGRNTLNYVRFIDDYPAMPIRNVWTDAGSSVGGEKIYVVQTSPRIVERCILMSTDPGDLVLDPTCGSGTTAYVAEQWGRRWITIDTSRVALALARARIMGARYPYYLLADSPEGQRKEAEVTRTEPKTSPTHGDIRHGFVYERVPHITLKSIANNAEIDVIWERFQEQLEPLRVGLNEALGESWEEWEIPREAGTGWSESVKSAHERWWQLRIERQREIDASIAAKADHEYLFDKPYVDASTVRVAGPFTVESLSPHRMLAVGADDEPLDPLARAQADEDAFVTMVLDNLKVAGVHQTHKEGRIMFTSLTPWPGEFVCAEGRYVEGEDGTERRAGVFVGPEFGTVARPDLVAAAREAADAGFDVLIACAFNYDAHATEFAKLGRVPVLKARMNADLHMAEDLKTTDKGNLFVLFGEPELELVHLDDGQLQVRVLGVDVFDPSTGEVRSADVDGIACWFIDTDYDEESFFVRHAYFLGASDPYKSLKTTLRAEIDEDAWSTLHSDVSRPFPKPSSGRLAVKVINHLGDEVMKVLRV